MDSGQDIYYKARDVVRRLGHSESDSCRVFKDWHIELRVGTGHVSVWTSSGIVFLTMLEKPVYHRPGPWEDYLSRLQQRRPLIEPPVELRALLRAQLLEDTEADNPAGLSAEPSFGQVTPARGAVTELPAIELGMAATTGSGTSASRVPVIEAPAAEMFTAEADTTVKTNGEQEPECVSAQEDIS